MKENVAWIDINKKQYRMSEISDSYLINILNFIGRGNLGWEEFTNSDIINRLYDELNQRGLKCKYKRNQLLDLIR